MPVGMAVRATSWLEGFTVALAGLAVVSPADVVKVMRLPKTHWIEG
jgi:hypothetical protein